MHNTYTTILSGRSLMTIIDGQKSNFNDKFKLEPIITYHLRFIMKMLLI